MEYKVIFRTKNLYLINNNIVFFDVGLIALIEILFQNIHNSMQKFNHK